MNSDFGWVGFDLDGTLAEYTHWRKDGGVGKPIWPMVNLLKQYLASGYRCKIFTARVCGARDDAEREEQIAKIASWCQTYVGQQLEVTHEKDYGMILLYDDRCVSVEANTGRRLNKHKAEIEDVGQAQSS